MRKTALGALVIVTLVLAGCSGGGGPSEECASSSNKAQCVAKKEAEVNVKVGSSCQDLSGEAYTDCEEAYAPKKRVEEAESAEHETEAVIKKRAAEENANILESVKE